MNNLRKNTSANQFYSVFFFPGLCLSSQNDQDQRFSVCSLVSSSPIQSIHSLNQSPNKVVPNYHHQHLQQSPVHTDSDTTCKHDYSHADHDDTTSLTSTLTTTSSSTAKTSSSCSTCTSSATQPITAPLHIDVNAPTNAHNDRYKAFEPRENTLSSKCESRTSLDSSSTSGGEVFNLGVRLNTFRFIDDSASSTALTSPCESSTHLYANAIKPYATNKLFHRQQQQHRLLNASNFKQTTPTSKTASTSSSRTVSEQSCSSSCSTSTSSTPDHKIHQRSKPRPNLATQLLQQKLKKEIKHFQHEQLTNDYLNVI